MPFHLQNIKALLSSCAIGAVFVLVSKLETSPSHELNKTKASSPLQITGLTSDLHSSSNFENVEQKSSMLGSDDIKDDIYPPMINDSFTQCGGVSSGLQDSSPSTLIVLNRFLPTGVELHCTLRGAFEFNHRELSLIMIVYGEKYGCPEDCRASNLCVIQDGQKSLLFSAFWQNDEAPLNLTSQCPGLAEESYGNTLLYCDSPPSGYYHPAAQTQEFRRLSIANEENPFKYCYWVTP